MTSLCKCQSGPPPSAARAAQLRALHRPGDPLILPNAWDAASARVVAEADFPAVATTSSGMALSLGWADGQKTPPTEMFAAIGRVARVVDLPVTADVEGGYGLPPEELAERLLATGAVGCNLEDTDHGGAGPLVDAAVQADYLRRVKQAARAAGVDLVLNARVDVFLRHVGTPPEQLTGALRRAHGYLEAGADCVFPFGVTDEATIAALVEGIPGPITIAARPGAPSPARLRELGVARVSFAGRLARLSLDDVQRRVATIRAGVEL
jgi:2-methylisocitrate lyase-like PEP mutase family enzyme